MGKKKIVRPHKDLVLDVHPSAVCIDRVYGKPYKQIILWSSVLGEGKTEGAAWTSAYRNIYGHR